MTITPASRIRTAGDALVRLARSYARAVAVQFARPLAPTLRDDTTERASGGKSDPTGDVASDARRLRLRAAVIAGEQALDSITSTATSAADDVDRAVAEWEGDAR